MQHGSNYGELEEVSDADKDAFDGELQNQSNDELQNNSGADALDVELQNEFAVDGVNEVFLIQAFHGFNDWGFNHPQRNIQSKKGGRIKWTAEELSIIQSLMLPSDTWSHNPFVVMLKKIIESPQYRVAFHPHHIMNNIRLREGVKAWRRADAKR
jgi:hypothetical protein